MNTPASNPLGVLNTLRALAAWMVCLYHFAFMFKESHPALVEGFDWGQNGVYVFFLISGVVLPWSMDVGNYQYKNAFQFLKKRMLRLYPPFALSVFVCAAAFHWGPRLWTWDIGQRIVDSLFFLVPFKHSHWINGVYWTLFVEFQFYLFLALVFPLMRNSKAWVRWSVLMGSLVLSFASKFFAPVDVKTELFFHLPVFVLGFYLYLYMKERIGQWEFLIGSVLTSYVMFYEMGILHGFMWNIPVFGFCAFVIVLFFRKGIPWLEHLGEISYSYYLMHFIFIAIANNYVRPNFTGEYGIWITVGILQIMAYMGAWMFYYIIERPSLRWTKLVKYK